MARTPAMVISLDFELAWGVRDRPGFADSYRPNLLGVRRAIPKMLALFREFDVAATWATVGFLFARGRDELHDYWPKTRPRYANSALDPYRDALGDDEQSDPVHFAPSLIAQILDTPRQEIGSHTFSHFYCLEAGADESTFRADIAAARAIAKQHDVELRSFVFPRNQGAPYAFRVLSDAGFRSFRGNEKSWLYAPVRRERQTPVHRAGRLMDACVNLTGTHTVGWDELGSEHGLLDVRASRFLRRMRRATPLDRLLLRRIEQSLEDAGARGRIMHLWWHPHNFGADVEGSTAFLRRVLQSFAKMRDRYGMSSLSMGEVATQHGVG
jgi:peptidoglycan/xylan/chitin deacetylase (PgdA/CDA1 family)